MATADRQRRWRARDSKRVVEVRLSPAALGRLDNLVARMAARGRGEVIERLLLADAGEHPAAFAALLNEAVRLARAYLQATGSSEAALRDGAGRTYVIRREP